MKKSIKPIKKEVLTKKRYNEIRRIMLKTIKCAADMAMSTMDSIVKNAEIK